MVCDCRKRLCLLLALTGLLVFALPAWSAEYLVFTRGAGAPDGKLSARSALNAAAGGTVLKEYGHLKAFKAELDEDQAAALRERTGLVLVPADLKLYAADATKAGHGTQVAGVLGGRTAGVCPYVEMVPMRIADKSGLVQDLSWITDAADRLVELAQGPLAGKNLIVNFSYSTETYDLDYSRDRAEAAEMESFFEELLASLSAPGNIFFVGASGNEYDDLDRTDLESYPACSSADMMVSAAAHDSGLVMSDFSNTGSTVVDLAAPGEDMYTADLNGSYVIVDGTSFAAPFTAGTAAYLWADDPGMTPGELKSRLEGIVDTGTDMDVITGGVLSPDMAFELEAGPEVSGDLEAAAQAWHLDEVREMRNHPEAFDFDSVVCFVWDTGVDLDHEELEGRLGLTYAQDFTGRDSIDPSAEILIPDDPGDDDDDDDPLLSPGGGGGCGVVKDLSPFIVILVLPYFLLSKM